MSMLTPRLCTMTRLGRFILHMRGRTLVARIRFERDGNMKSEKLVSTLGPTGDARRAGD